MAFRPIAALVRASALILLISALPAHATGKVIGVVAPLEGPYAILGKQVADGASVRAAAQGDSAVVVGDSCASGGGSAIVDRLVQEHAGVAIGFLCTETLEEALPGLKSAGIAAITLGVRSNVLMEDALKAGWPLFRLAPSQTTEVESLADTISTQWTAEPFALIDDGAIGNHDLLENLRASLEDKGVKPVLTDTLRPGQDQQLTLVRHLSSAGVLRAFIAADRDDVAVLARDITESGLPITLLAGASLDTTPGTVQLAAGVQALVLSDAAAAGSNAELVKALRAANIEPEGYVMPAISAVETAELALDAAAAEKKPVAEALLGRAFDTVAGPVRFTERHELTENPYTVMQWDGHAFVVPPKQ